MAGRSKTPSIDGGPALTPKQAEFCAEFVRNGNNATQAYLHAYDAENMTYEAVRVEASRLMDCPNVSLAIRDMQTTARKLSETTIDEYLTELESAVSRAYSEGATGAAVRALELKGKVLGFYVDRIQNETANPAEILESLRNLLPEGAYEVLRAQLGLDLTDKPSKTTH